MKGDMVLNLARAHLARFVSFPNAAALDLCSLWAAHTHCRTTSDRLALATSPRLLLLSDLPASGKSAALDRITSLSFNPRTVVDPTPMSLATLIDEARPTVAFDEVDCAFGNGQAKQQVRSILNMGYKPPGEWSRGRGDPIATFAPIAMAGLGKRVRVASELAALRSRSIIVEMRPATPPEEYWEADHGALTRTYREMLTTWCRRNLHDILNARPVAPAGIEGRQKEIIYPLLQIAQVAGGHWPATVADAARQLLLGAPSTRAPIELSMFEQLLVDLKEVYGNEAKLPTSAIVDGLYDLPSGNWSALWPNRNKAPRELAAVLAPLGVESISIRTGPGPNDTARGYHREGLENLWDEMLSQTDDTLSDTIDLDEEAMEGASID